MAPSRSAAAQGTSDAYVHGRPRARVRASENVTQLHLLLCTCICPAGLPRPVHGLMITVFFMMMVLLNNNEGAEPFDERGGDFP